ncbi:TPA: DUF4145 domain-containing protein [Serratia marcescens]|nr:DUF4145 domain-containing protein [Serratia marcescens]
MTVHKISEYFNQDLDVDWPCPSCHQKTLQIIKDTFIVKNTAETNRLLQSCEYFEYEWDSTVFVCIAKCMRPQCQEVVACSGVGGTEMAYDEEGPHLEGYYQPKNFSPTLHPFLITEQCEMDIKAPLIASFSVYFNEPGSAANLIRIAVERLLTVVGIPSKDNNNGYIKLHHRIEMLKGKYAPYKDHLMAIKFLGNAGSHTYDEVTTTDIEDAFEIMDYVINNLFSEKIAQVEMHVERLSTKFDMKKKTRNK